MDTVGMNYLGMVVALVGALVSTILTLLVGFYLSVFKIALLWYGIGVVVIYTFSYQAYWFHRTIKLSKPVEEGELV